MSSARTFVPLRSQPNLRFLIAGFTLLCVATPLAPCQRIGASPALPSSAFLASDTPLKRTGSSVQADAMLTLPDSPGATLFSSSTSVEPAPAQSLGGQLGFGTKSDAELARHPASVTDKFIFPGQVAPKLTAKNKLEMGLIHGVSPISVMGWFVSSGYSHVTDGAPNYGVDKGAFGARLGASALRGYSEEVFQDSITSQIFHQDARYYKLGPGQNFATRTGYSLSRILITRNDNGRLAPNYSLVSGNLLGAALTNAYYPEANRGLGQTARTFGSAMYGAAFSYFADEFLSDVLERIHLRPDHD